jgi:large repetitive protein
VPLAPTGNTPVIITASYGSLPPVSVPVRVDLSRKLVSLQFTGVSAQSPLRLDGLNAWTPLPTVEGVFDDGTRVQVTDQFPVDINLDPSAAGILEYDPARGVRAVAIVPEGSPLTLTLSLRNQPSVQAVVPIVARDGLPKVTLSCPASVRPGQQLLVTAQPADDVGVNRVDFLLNGGLLSSREKAPYELSLAITEQSLNQTLTVGARVTDTVGQTQDAVPCRVQVVPDVKTTVPGLTVELPTPLQRVVEKTPIRYQLGTTVAIGSTGRLCWLLPGRGPHRHGHLSLV